MCILLTVVNTVSPHIKDWSHTKTCKSVLVCLTSFLVSCPNSQFNQDERSPTSPNFYTAYSWYIATSASTSPFPVLRSGSVQQTLIQPSRLHEMAASTVFMSLLLKVVTMGKVVAQMTDPRWCSPSRTYFANSRPTARSPSPQPRRYSMLTN